MSPSKPSLPKNVFHAHELFLRALHFDQQGQVNDARRMYLRTGKIFTALLKKFPDMALVKLWAEEARLALKRIDQLNASHLTPSTRSVKSASSKMSVEQSDLRQRILRTRLVPNPKLSWADVCGLDRVVQELKDTVLLPLTYPELLQGNITTARNVLLFGPPGCGKSYLVKVLAAESKISPFNVSAATLMSKWFGESQKMIRVMYEAAWERAPSIIFIDEFDGLFGGSASSEGSESSATAIQIQKELQQYMDGFHTPEVNQTVLIAATNFPWHLEDSLLRRFDRILYVPPPTPEVIAALLQHLLKGISHSLSPIQIQWLAHELRGRTPSEIRKICEAARLRPYKEQRIYPTSRIRPLNLQDIKVCIPWGKAMMEARGKKGVGTIHFLEWNVEKGFPSIAYPIQPWERPGYHPSDDPNPIVLG